MTDSWIPFRDRARRGQHSKTFDSKPFVVLRATLKAWPLPKGELVRIRSSEISLISGFREDPASDLVSGSFRRCTRAAAERIVIWSWISQRGTIYLLGEYFSVCWHCWRKKFGNYLNFPKSSRACCDSAICIRVVSVRSSSSSSSIIKSVSRNRLRVKGVWQNDYAPFAAHRGAIIAMTALREPFHGGRYIFYIVCIPFYIL